MGKRAKTFVPGSVLAEKAVHPGEAQRRMDMAAIKVCAILSK